LLVTAPLFSAEALAPLREANRASLTSRLRAESLTRAASQGGGANTGARAWTIVADDVPCRISPAQLPAAATVADQATNLSRWVVATDVETPIFEPGMRLTVTGEELLTHEPFSRVVIIDGGYTPRTFSAMRLYQCVDAGPGQR
jgi:hypothetical protein